MLHGGSLHYNQDLILDTQSDTVISLQVDHDLIFNAQRAAGSSLHIHQDLILDAESGTVSSLHVHHNDVIFDAQSAARRLFTFPS